jgi:hypothetical protein
MEVSLSELTGLKIGPRKTLDAGQLLPGAERVLEEGFFHLQHYWTEEAGEAASPSLTQKTSPPSDSPHLPRAGGGKLRRRRRRCSNPAAEKKQAAAERTKQQPTGLRKSRLPLPLPSPPRSAREEERPAAQQIRG